jgi:hypothetical protein
MKFLMITLMACFSTQGFAHSGGTNSSGCHNDRKNGGYHCHHNAADEMSSSRTPASTSRVKIIEKKKVKRNKSERIAQ